MSFDGVSARCEGGLLPANEIITTHVADTSVQDSSGTLASASNSISGAGQNAMVAPESTTTPTPAIAAPTTTAPRSTLAPTTNPTPATNPSPPQNANADAPTLRTHLLAALATHPGTRTFHLHALVSNPRRTPELFPFATPRPPRVWVQDIMVLVSEEGLEEEKKVEEDGKKEEDGRPRTPPLKETSSGSGGGTCGRVLTTGILASLFLIPSTSSGILYISKVDTTGQSLGPSPTSLLVRALISFYLNPTTRPAPARAIVNTLWVHVFARAQGQYLFSASVEWPKKKPLGDTQLCAWWRRVLGRVARDVKADVDRCGGRMRSRYVLPGMSEEEAEHAIRAAGGGGGTEEGWVYGHPYDGPERDGIGLPCPQPNSVSVPVAGEGGDGGESVTGKRKYGVGGINLGCVIPSFDDDPKSRFMDEIAYTTDAEIRSPQRKKARTASAVAAGVRSSGSFGASLAASGTGTGAGGNNTEEEKPLGELGKVSADEFWERMSFRQECVAGAVTGFFTIVAGGSSQGSTPGTGSMAGLGDGLPGHVSGAMHKRVVTTLLTGVEFSTRERACKATETVEGAIKGLCEAGPADVVGRPAAVPSTPPRRRGGGAGTGGMGVEEEVLGNYGLIYGAVSTRNAVVGGGRTGGPGEDQTIRVLAVRRKKKK